MHNPTTFVIFAPMTNNHKIVDYDAVLDAKFGKEGTPERARAEEAAYSFYSGQILQDARKEAKMTQSELAVAAALSRHRAALAAPCHFLFPLHHPADAFHSEFHPRHPIFGHVGDFFVGLLVTLRQNR